MLIIPVPPIHSLNKIFRESVNESEILGLLTPMIKAYALERTDGERFGDFVIRKGIITPTLSGKQFCTSRMDRFIASSRS